MQVPALCRNCGGITAINLQIAFQPGWRVVLSGNMTDCRHCGSVAEVADGVFEIAENAIKIISAPDITISMLRSLGRLINIAYREKKQVDELEANAALIDPRLGAAIQLAKQAGGYTWVILLVDRL
jgi:hypothetical protein